MAVFSFAQIVREAEQKTAFRLSRRATSPDVTYIGPILRVLHRGEATVDGAIHEVEKLVQSLLTAKDRTMMSSKGKQNIPYWRNRAEHCRRLMADLGIIDDSRSGIWKLTDSGKMLATELMSLP